MRRNQERTRGIRDDGTGRDVTRKATAHEVRTEAAHPHEAPVLAEHRALPVGGANGQSVRAVAPAGNGMPSGDDALGLYLQQMGSIPRLDRQQEIELTRRLESLRRRYRRAALCSWAVLAHVVETFEDVRAGRLLLDRVMDVLPQARRGLVETEERLPRNLDMLRRLLRTSAAEFGQLLREETPALRKRYRRANQTLLRRAVILAEELSPRTDLLQRWTDELRRHNAQVQDLAGRGPSDRLCALLQAVQALPQELAALVEVIERRRAAYQQVRRALVEANLRLVVSVAKHYRSRGLPFADLIQEGNSGLMRAVDRFEPSLGFKFGTYATWWIRERISRALADHTRTVRLPQHQLRTLAAIDRVRSELKARHGREPAPEEIAAILEIPVEEMCSLQLAGRPALSLDEPIDGDGEMDLQDFLGDAETDLAEVVDHDLFRERLAEVLRCLAPRDREVIELRFGLRDGQPRTLDEVAQAFGVTRERIRQIEARGLLKLRQPDRRKRLAGFAEVL